MTEQCDNCRYWKHEAADYGTCRRFPTHVFKQEDDWCGEWTPDAMAEIERMGAEIYDQNRS